MKSNMYEGVTTWNPLGGECPHKCTYCSTNNLKRFPGVKAKYSGPLCLYPGYPKETNKTVFVCAQNDLFADNVNSRWISEVIRRCNCVDNTYLFQTKNPKRFMEFYTEYPNKSIFCTTIETNRTYPSMEFAPSTRDRAMTMNEFIQEYPRCDKWNYQVTIEPIINFNINKIIYLIETCLPDQVNIGADSKRNDLPEPSKGKILALIAELEKFTVVVQKSNLARLLK